MKIFRSSALRRWLVPAVILCLFVGGMANASQGDVHGTSLTFLWIALLLILAKSASLVERWGQPAVLGELVAGVILGNLALVGIHTFQPILDDTFIKFLAELGVVILLFQIGLESNIQDARCRLTCIARSYCGRHSTVCPGNFSSRPMALTWPTP